MDKIVTPLKIFNVFLRIIQTKINTKAVAQQSTTGWRMSPRDEMQGLCSAAVCTRIKLGK